MGDISIINIGSSDYNVKDATARSSISQIDAKLASKSDIGHTHDEYISVDANGNAAIQGTFSALAGINATEGEVHAQKFVLDDMGKLGTSDQILLGNGSTTSLSELIKQLNTTGLAITGVLDMTKQSTAASMIATVAGMKASQMKFYLIGDSSGNIAGTSETSVTFNSSVAALFGKSSMGASVGDLLVIAKLNGIGVYRIIPLNDAKSANGSFPGCDGLETIWDKTQINKIPSIETTSNNALPRSEALPHRGATNMNEALETGIYPWCTLGRPTGATGAFTCITKKSSNKDGNGYYSIEQTAYGRTNELGQVFKRIIFISDSDALWGDWERIDSSQAISDISNLSAKIDNSCFKCYYGEFDMKNCGEDGVYMYGTSDKPLGGLTMETFSLIVSEAGRNVTYGGEQKDYRGEEFSYAIRQVAYSNIHPERIFTRIIFTNNKNIEASGNVTVWENGNE